MWTVHVNCITKEPLDIMPNICEEQTRLAFPSCSPLFFPCAQLVLFTNYNGHIVASPWLYTRPSSTHWLNIWRGKVGMNSILYDYQIINTAPIHRGSTLVYTLSPWMTSRGKQYLQSKEEDISSACLYHADDPAITWWKGKGSVHSCLLSFPSIQLICIGDYVYTWFFFIVGLSKLVFHSV